VAILLTRTLDLGLTGRAFYHYATPAGRERVASGTCRSVSVRSLKSRRASDIAENFKMQHILQKMHPMIFSGFSLRCSHIVKPAS